MKKSLTAILLILSVLAFQTVGFADGITKIKTMEGYDSPYVENATGTHPEEFVALMPSRAANTGSYYDESRNSQTLKLGNLAEAHLPFGEIYKDGKLHVSFDVYQGYPEGVESAKNKTLDIYFSANNTGTFVNGAINGVMQTVGNTYKKDDPNALVAGQGQYLLSLGCENQNSPLFFIAPGWARGYAPDSVMTAHTWHKVDMYFDKDDATMEIYFDGKLLEAYQINKATYEYTDTPVNQKLWIADAWTSWKSVFFRFEGAKHHVTEARIPGSTVTDGGYVLLDNVYVNKYSSDTDKLILMKDDIKGEGVSLANGIINIAFNEYTDRPAEMSDITIKHVATGKEVTDYTLLQSDNMQFSIQFGNLDAGRYEVSVDGIYGSATGNAPQEPIYFNTSKQYQDGISVPWVDSVEYLSYNGEAQNIHEELTTATSGIRVNFTEPVNLNDTVIEENLLLYCEGEPRGYSSYEISDDNKSVTLVPEGLLEGASDYRFEVAAGITALESDEVYIIANPDTGLAYGVDFTVADDARMEISGKLSVNSGDSTASFNVNAVKTNSDSLSATGAVACYADEAAEDGTVYRKLIGIKCVPVELAAEDRCVADFTTEALDLTGADTVKAFLWSWPHNVSIYSETVDLN
ncbi:MAG: hypothetical protein J6D26_00865 [Clostridia bacterium]|nr:hypothetical protein [Clostridia bacterium]